MFESIKIAHPSPRVLGKLRKGHRVRIMSGSGLSLIVQADRYNPITKSFGKGKAYTLELSPEEIQANMNPPEEMAPMEGTGLFGSIGKAFKGIGKSAKKTFSKKNFNPIAKAIIPVGKDLLKQGVGKLADMAPEIGATLGSSALSGLALMAGQPQLVPLAQTAGSQLGKKGGEALGGLAKKEVNKRIDKFDPYHQNQRSKGPPSRQSATNFLSSPVGVGNYLQSPVGVANYGNYLQSLSNETLEMELARRRGGGYSTPFDQSGGKQVLAPYTDAVGQGLYAQGRGLYAQGSGRGIRNRKKMKESASIGIHGNLLGHGLPPALQSQPYSSNFQMASRLPPAFASQIRGNGLYAQG